MVSYTNSFLLLWYTKWYTTGILSIPYPIYSVHGRVACKAWRKWLVAILGISSLVLWPTVIFCCCLLPEMVYKTYYNFVKSMLRSIIFPFQQIQIHPNPNVFIFLVDVTENRWRSSLFIRSCPGSVRLTILVISFMNQVHKI